MSKSITDVFDISAENTSETGPLLSVAGLRSRSTLYKAEIRNLERRVAYKARRGERTVSIGNRLARVGQQNATIEGEVNVLRYVAEGTDGKATIFGQVTVGGVGVEGLIVAAYDLEGKAIEPAVKTDAEGGFVLVVDPAQRVRIVVSTADLEVLECVDKVFDLVKEPAQKVRIQIDSAEPVPIDPEYPCELPPDDGGDDDTDDDTVPEVEPVIVPDLIGLTLEEASDALIAVGLSGDFETRADRERDGVVIEQGVPAGHKVDPGTAIPAVIAEIDLPRVPDVRGKRSEDASVILRDAGFEPAVVVTSADGTPGFVLDQFPEPEAQAAPGSRVGVMVIEEKQPDLVEVPPVVELPLNEASVALREGGLQVGVLTEEPVTDGKDGIVLKQDPESGGQVPRGTPVDLTLSSLRMRERAEMPRVTGTALQSTRALASGNWADVRIGFAEQSGNQFRVIGQKPAEGVEIPGGGVVSLEVRHPAGWRDRPQDGVAQLFQFSPDWLAAGASAAVTKTLAQAMAERGLDELKQILDAGPDAAAEALGLEAMELAQPLHDALGFAIRAMAPLT